MVLKRSCHSASGREGLQSRYSGVVKRFDHSDHKIHSSVEVGAVDDSVVSMRRASRNQNGSNGDPDIVKLDGPCIVSETGNEIELQRNVLGGGNFLHVSNELAVREFTEGVEHHARTSAKNFLGGVGTGAGNIVGNANLQTETQVRFN